MKPIYKAGLLFLAILMVIFAASVTLKKGNRKVAGEENTLYSGVATVRITKDGFFPEEIRVTKGTTVIFENKDEYWHWPASDIHPSHSIYPEFDPGGAIGPGKNWEFIFDRVGEWGYHDHLSPYIVGKIIVIE